MRVFTSYYLGLSLVFVFSLFTGNSFAQCKAKANGQLNAISISCGQSVNLSAIGIDGNFIVNRDFNDGTIGDDWEGSPSGEFTNPCVPALDGSTYLWFGPSANVPRGLTTFGYDVRTGGTISFDMRYSIEPNDNSATPASCEGPDLPEEGVYLQYSTDNGASWINIFYWDPYDGDQDPNTPVIDPVTGNGTIDSLVNWKNRTFAIPTGARTVNTKFRWYQDAGSGAAADHWGLDNVRIQVPGNPYYFIWQHTGIVSKTTPAVSPGVTTTYQVLNTNGVDSCYASVVVNVNNSNTVTAKAARYSICPSDTTRMLVSSNLFTPDPNMCAVGPTGSGCPPGFSAAPGSPFTLGTGTQVNGYNSSTVNIFGDFGDDAFSTSQIIYRAAELRAAGLKAGYINSVAFDLARTNEDGAGNAYPSFSVGIGCTNATQFGTSNDEPPLTGLTDVFTRSSFTINNGWTVINFDRSYVWDGVSNIVVSVCWYQPDGQTGNFSAKTTNTNVGYNAVLLHTSNFSNGNCVIEFPTSQTSSRPNTRFGLCTAVPSGNIKFVWTPTAGLDNPGIFNPISTPGATTTYTVQVYDLAHPQCAVSDTANVIVKPAAVPTISVVKNKYCQGETVNLSVTAIPSAGTTFTWTRNGVAIPGGATVADVPPAGTIKYTVIPSFGGCLGISKDTTITVFANPVTPVVTPQLVCNSQPATHNITNTPNPFTSSTKYTWTGPGGFNPVTLTRSVTRNPSISGNYTVFARDTVTGCVSTTTPFVVNTNAAPPDPVLSSNGAGICPGAVLNLNATTENKPAGTAGAGTTRTDTTYTYAFAWTGPGTITNANTKNATVNPTTVGSKTYSFAYNKTTSVTSCTRNPVSGACVGAATVVAGYPVTCPSNSKTVLVDIIDFPSFANRKVICNGTNDSLAVSFDISGGTPPYTITGTTTGTITGSTFTSKKIPAPGATSYSFDIKDTRNCSAVVVSGTKNCAIACATSLGAITNGSQSICGGSPGTATITYSTSGEDAIVGNATELVLHSGTLPSGTIYQRKPVGVSVPFTLQAGMTKGVTYYVTAVRGILTSGNVDLNDGCTEISPRVAVVYNDKPTANVTPLPAEICSGAVDTLVFNFSGTGPYDVTYDNGSASTTRFNKADGFKEFVTPSSSTTYTITSVKDAGTGCIENSASSLGSADVTIVGAPTAGVASYVCNAAQDSFYVKFPITGGDYMSYSVKDSLGANALTLNHYGVGVDSFISKAATANGMTYAYTLSDANNCNPILVTGTFSCKCITDAGTMKTDIVYRLCAGASTPSGLSKNDYNLDANDIIRYVLHRGSATKIVDPIDTNTSTVFAFNSHTMVYQASYYISAIAASRTAAGDLDTLDACLSIAPVGTEVIWNTPAEAAISGNQTICPGSAASIRFNMLGQSPFKVVYTEGSKTITLNNISSPYDTIVYPTSKTVYKLVSVADARCAGGIVNTAAVTITVDTLDKAKIRYTPNVVCLTGTANQVQINKVTAGGTYSANSTDLNIHPTSGVINVKLSKVGVYSVKYQTRGSCPAVDSTSFTIDAPVVAPSLLYTSDVFCKNDLNPSPSRLTPVGGTVRASDPSKLKFVGLNTGVIDLAASTFGKYSVIYTIVSSNACPNKADTVAISINDVPPTTHTIGPRVLCVGDPVSVNYVGSPSYNLTWDMGINADVRNSKKHTNTVRWSKAGMQYLTLAVSDQLTKCKSATVRDSVLVYAQPFADFDVSDSLPYTTTVAEQHEFIFSETAFGETAYEWDFGDGSPRINQTTAAPVSYIYPKAGTYEVSLKVSNPGGCSDTKAKGTIVVTGEGDLYIPTGFSPNADDINDYFKPIPIGIKSMSFVIFSRWGEFIYRGTLTDKGWDGTFKNAPAPDGVYVYIIENATTFENTNKTYPAGIVTLSR